MISFISWSIWLAIALPSVHIFVDGASASWGYEGPNGPPYWKKSYPTCAGSRQSPIDIDSAAAAYDGHLTPIKLLNFDKTAGSTSAKMKNNGHTVVAEVPNSDYYVEGGGLHRSKLVQFHAHWGKTDASGSEHTLDGKSFPMEIHFVTYAEKYGDFATAATKEDGLAVLGFFVQVGSSENAHWSPMTSLMNKVHYSGKTESMPPFKPMDLIPSSRDKYYRYTGSLTTPGCNEVVTWTVFREPIIVSEAQMAEFRKLMSTEDGVSPGVSMSGNFRPVQSLNGREILTSISSGHALSATSAIAATVLLGWITSRLL